LSSLRITHLTHRDRLHGRLLSSLLRTASGSRLRLAFFFAFDNTIPRPFLFAHKA